MVPPIIVTEDTPPDMLAGSMDLTVVLPDRHSLKMSVERSTPMMDLLVQVTTANKLSPAGYIIQPLNERGSLPYKPSTPIGALDAWTIHVVPKHLAQCTAVKRHLKTMNQPFEQTFRLQVHLPRNQLFVARVSPKTRLADILIQVCSEKNLDPVKYSLRHPGNLDQVLSLSCSLADYKLQELTLVCNRTHPVEVSTVDIMSLQRDPSNPAYRNTLCEGSVSSGSLEGRSLSPVPSDESSASPPPLPPSRPTRKRRPAPKPPISHQKPANEEKQVNGTQSSKVINHSRNSSDSSGYHEASVLSESPQSNSVPEPLSQNKVTRMTEDTSKLVLSQSMTDVSVIQPPLKQASSYNSMTSLSSITGRKKKAAPPPPVVGKIRASSLIEDQQRTPSVSSTASSTTTLDGNEMNVTAKSATLPPSSRLNTVPPPAHTSPPPTSTVEVEPPATIQEACAPAPRPRSKLVATSELEGCQSHSGNKPPSSKKQAAPQPKPRTLLLTSSSIVSSQQEDDSQGKLDSSLVLNENTDQRSLTLEDYRNSFIAQEQKITNIDSSDPKNKILSGTEFENQKTSYEKSHESLHAERLECDQPVDVDMDSQSSRGPDEESVVGLNTDSGMSPTEIRMVDEEIDRIFTNATKNHSDCEFKQEDQITSLPSPPNSLTQSELAESPQVGDSLDWEYQLPAPPTFRDETKSPSVTEFGTITLGNLSDVLCSETVISNKERDLESVDNNCGHKTDERHKNDVASAEMRSTEVVDSPEPNIKLIEDNRVKSVDNNLSNLKPNIKLIEDNGAKAESYRSNSEICLQSEEGSKQCIKQTVVNDLTQTLNHTKAIKLESEESVHSVKKLSSSSTLDNFTITTYKDKKPIEVFEDDSIKSSVGEKRDKSKDDAVFRAPKARVKEPNLSRTSSFSMENKLNGPLIKRSVSYVSLLAANMPRHSQPYRAHLTEHNSEALWPKLRKTTSELNIDSKEVNSEGSSLWQSPENPPELQSVQVLRNILSRSHASLSTSTDQPETNSQQRHSPVSYLRTESPSDDHNEGKKWTRSQSEVGALSSSKWSSKSKFEHSLSLDEDYSNYSNLQRGPPSINLSTWSERPKQQISIKDDGDYRFGFGKKCTWQEEAVTQDQQKKNSELSSNKEVNYKSQGLHNKPHEGLKLESKSKSISDLSRIPIVTAVELKKPYAVRNCDTSSAPNTNLQVNCKNLGPENALLNDHKNSDDSFVGVNSLARRFGVPQKRPSSVYDCSSGRNYFHSVSDSKFENISRANTIDRNTFSTIKISDSGMQESNKSVGNNCDSASEIKAQAKIRSGGFIEDLPEFCNVNKTQSQLYLSRTKSNSSTNLSPKKESKLCPVNSNNNENQLFTNNPKLTSSNSCRVAINAGPVRQVQTLDRNTRPVNLHPVVKGFTRVTVNPPPPPSTFRNSVETSNKEETKLVCNVSNVSLNQNSSIYKTEYQVPLRKPNFSPAVSTNITELAKGKTGVKDSNMPSSNNKATSVSTMPVPPPPPLLPTLRPVGERKGVKFLPPPTADPRDLLMNSIRSFNKDSLNTLSK